MISFLSFQKYNLQLAYKFSGDFFRYRDIMGARKEIITKCQEYWL